MCRTCLYSQPQHIICVVFLVYKLGNSLELHMHRDTFYSVLREWEKYHEKPNWSMLAALGDKIRLHLSYSANPLARGNMIYIIWFIV